ncbi:MAG: hypothetical protein AB1Z98_06780 [Nannocystaceae bacterium]
MTQREPCVPNLGPQEQLKRWIFAGLCLLVTVAAVVWMRDDALHRALRLPLAVPVWLGLTSILQAREKT